MTKNILVIAAHPDDEVLGCGGAIARHVANGDMVSVCYMTNGISARGNIDSSEITQRQKAANNAIEILGIEEKFQFDFPDNQMDTVSLLEVTQAVESVIDKTKPEIIYTHFAYDLNIDHRIVHQAVLTAARPQSSSPIKSIFYFEVLSSTEWNFSSEQAFRPNYIVDISQYWLKKLAALKAYHSEMREYPHSRSYKALEALSILRGATNGVEMAEGFVAFQKCI